MEKVSGQNHLVEEYYYTSKPSLAKFRQSRATSLDLVTVGLTILALIHIVHNAVQGQFGWGDAMFFVIGVLIVLHTGEKVYRALFTELSGRHHGTWDVGQALLAGPADPSDLDLWGPDQSPWIAEIDRYDGTRPDEYHREFVRVGAASQPEAIAAVKYESGVSEDDIIYIREVTTETETVSPTVQVRANSIWADYSDDPTKVYTTWRLGGLNAYQTHDLISNQQVVGHTIAGLSNLHVQLGRRTFVESVVLLELHELTHWALDPDEQPQDPTEERGWNRVLLEQIDYTQDEQPDGPWYDEERDIRVKLTSRAARENATERISQDTGHRPPVSSQTESY